MDDLEGLGIIMQSGIFSLLLLTIIFAIFIFRANKEMGKIGGVYYYLHVFFAWLLLAMHSTGVSRLGLAIGHPQSILEYYYNPIGPLPAWFNLSSWVGYLVYSISGIIVALALAKRKERGRKRLLWLIPFLYLFTVAEFLKGFYSVGNDRFVPLVVAILINAIPLAIPFGAIYLFYRMSKVKDTIFIKGNAEDVPLKRIVVIVTFALTLIVLLRLTPLPQKIQGLVGGAASLFVESHVIDETGTLTQAGHFDDYLHSILRESDVDIRIVVIRNTDERSIEEIAIEKVQELGIGGINREERGVLLLYDVEQAQMRIEVGYGLESYFPDSFVGYVLRDHTEKFFSSGNLNMGLRLLIRILHHRIREAVLGKSFDPEILEILSRSRDLSGGAGASTKVDSGMEGEEYWKPGKTRGEYYSPQATPEEAYEKYLEWIIAQEFVPRVNIFTSDTQNYLASVPMSKAYFNFLLMQEYGTQYKIDTREDVALLYFTSDPLVSPHFFIKSADGWQMDIVAETRNSKSISGGIYIWSYLGSKDIYSRTFSDKLVSIKGYRRIRDGDNRELPVRSTTSGGRKLKRLRNLPRSY